MNDESLSLLFKTAAKSIDLSDEEKTILLDAIIHRASLAGTLGAGAVTPSSDSSELAVINSSVERLKRSEATGWWYFRASFNRNIIMPIILIIALVASGGVSFAAENSLPGDALYPIKLSVNENVRAGFTFGSEAKAAYDAKRAEKRLIEAEKLAAEGRLSADAQAQVEANFERFADRVEARIEAIAQKQPEKAAAIAAQFEAALEAHGAVLAKLASSAQAEARGPIIDLTTRVRTHGAEIANIASEGKAGGSTQTQSMTDATTSAGSSGDVSATTNTNVSGSINTKTGTTGTTSGNTQGSVQLKVRLGQ